MLPACDPGRIQGRQRASFRCPLSRADGPRRRLAATHAPAASPAAVQDAASAFDPAQDDGNTQAIIRMFQVCFMRCGASCSVGHRRMAVLVRASHACHGCKQGEARPHSTAFFKHSSISPGARLARTSGAGCQCAAGGGHRSQACPSVHRRSLPLFYAGAAPGCVPPRVARPAGRC